MTQEKQQLDKIVELYNSGIEENINIAIETANNIFGISKYELDYMAFYRNEEPFRCRFEQEISYTGSGLMNYAFDLHLETRITIKSEKLLPLCLSQIFIDV
jgi:hypothetical protein